MSCKSMAKLRGRFDLPKDQYQEMVMSAAKQHPGIIPFLMDNKSKR